MRWQFLEPDQDLVNRLERELQTTSTLARVLASRGLDSLGEVRAFLQPSLKALHDPFLMQDMDIAAARVVENIRKNKPLLVFGDYDVDGTTGAAMLYLALTSLGARVITYIPNRESEGYGLSTLGVDAARASRANLIITCDCGITARDSVNYAADHGIEVIITDHHIPGDKLPQATAILNPKRQDCKYPFKGLCGGGVAFKLACAVATRMGKPDEYIFEYLDLITLGTAADMVPILDENRAIVTKGLKLIEKSVKPGIRALVEKSGIRSARISVGQLVFSIAPKINAAGRLGDANRAVELLVSNDEFQAQQLAGELVAENKRRQEIQQGVVDEVMLMIKAQIDLLNDRAIVLAEEGWHPGVVGIVASKVKEEYHRPAVIISIDEDGIGKGSARSISGLDLHAALSAVSTHLEEFGGHSMAAGLTVKKDNYPAFKKAFLEVVNRTLAETDLTPSIMLDAEISLEEIDSRFMDFLGKMGPYGPGNMRPKFAARNLEIVGNPLVIGNGDHVRFRVRQGRRVLNAIGFNQVRHYEKLIKGFPVDLAFVVENNEWQGHTTTQLNVRDIQLNQPR
jgi:single-stranded-DNA-specific exonuclease